MVNLKSSAFLFIGDETYLKEKAIKELKSSLLADSSQELDYKIFYGGETNARDILNYATTFPFLAAKKLIVVKDFEKLEDEDKTRLIAYVKKPSKFTCLVLDASGEAALEDIRSINRYVKVVRFDNLTDSQFRSWVKQFLASRDKTIEEDAIEILKELQGKSLSSLVQELEKLTVFVGERNVISEEDVEGLVGKSFMRTIFDLAWAIGEKKTDEALKLAAGATSAGKKTYEIIGLLCWHLKKLLKAKMLQLKGESDISIARILRINRAHSNEFFKQTSSYSVDQLKSKMEALLQTDLDIKRARFDPVLMLEFAIIDLCLT